MNDVMKIGYVAPFTTTEDHRKTGLKNGIRQLTNKQIARTLMHGPDMALDHGNFVDGKFCPLAIGVHLDRIVWAKPPTNDAVASILHTMGYRVNNTRGVAGEFYRDHRFRDYHTAAHEVLTERGEKRSLSVLRSLPDEMAAEWTTWR